MRKLTIKELFYTLQGEGANAGIPMIFIRLAYCNKNCWYCDTDWLTGVDTTIERLLEITEMYPSKRILWTGGEPTLQLTEDVVDCFKVNGYWQAIETNGSNRVPDGIDYISCSPKVPPSVLDRSFAGRKVNEFRYPMDVKTKKLPLIENLPPADNYYVSPIFLGKKKKRLQINYENLRHCIKFIEENPQWRLSIQQHKIWDIR